MNLIKLEKLIKNNISNIKNKKGNFCMSSLIPREWNTEEEEKWDKDIEYECVKGRINKIIIEKIKKQTEKKYSASNANFRIIFNLNNYTFEIEDEPLFLFGRYEKYSRKIAQTRWVCRQCRGKGCEKCEGKGKHYLSIEEIIGEEFKKEFKCKNYFLHASGREDVDVENNAGRPFVLELIDPENIEGNLKKIEKKLEKDGRVKIKDLRFVNRDFVELVSNSHFNKSYVAEIENEKKFTKEDLKKIEKLKGKMINQRTPTRVKHRRADKVRKRRIIEIKILECKKNKVTIEVITEPGTYIKELINGDEGRTKPSISGILKTKVVCKKLTINRIFDGFLDSVYSD